MTAQPSELITDLAQELNQLHHRLAETQARLAALQTSSPASTTQPVKPEPKLGRRKVLRRLGGGLVAAGIGTVALPTLNTFAAPTGPVANSITHFQSASQSPVNAPAGASFVQTIMGAAFLPAQSGTNYTINTGGTLSWSGGGITGEFYCPLYLPDGVKVTDITFYFIDNDPTYDMVFGLYKNTLAPPALNSSGVFFVYSSSSSPNLRVISQTGSSAAPVVTIDNNKSGYVLKTSFSQTGSAQALCGVTVTYTNLTAHFAAA